jgi:hypothetical protein
MVNEAACSLSKASIWIRESPPMVYPPVVR